MNLLSFIAILEFALLICILLVIINATNNLKKREKLVSDSVNGIHRCLKVMVKLPFHKCENCGHKNYVNEIEVLDQAKQTLKITEQLLAGIKE